MPAFRFRPESMELIVAANIAATSNPTHVADLRESGRLHLSQPRLADGVLTAKHPLLGEISLSASALLILDRTDKEKK